MSDRNPSVDFGQFGPTRPKRLVEECSAVCIGAVQRRFGKAVLLQAMRCCEPIRIPISYHPPFEVCLSYSVLPLVGKPGRWSSLESGTARLWFCCPGCRRSVAKLFCYPLPNTSQLSDLLCRHCHALIYLTTNCGSNRWFKEVARPLKRLLREREGLPWKLGARHQDRLAEIDAQIRRLKDKVKPRGRRPHLPASNLALRKKRIYRDVSLLE